ncbi:hypothetical protein GCM10007362_23660 [Saccharibacillus endophyticus]|uniref:Uncharacterized protein n=1 Tax=Saccharibacillus endophyticus TaxID=2060666 RepID=A0ABQ1ZSN9_9BACL|nr:hypothetical protein GCM10007362_23660 [Saccharibacillus endophyticus]
MYGIVKLELKSGVWQPRFRHITELNIVPYKAGDKARQYLPGNRKYPDYGSNEGSDGCSLSV